MTDKFEKDLIEKIRKERESLQSFSSTEKSILRERVMRYAKENPISKPMESFKISLYNRVLVPVLSVFLIFGGVGISAAAEGSLPGDLLYPIKVSINEVVREAFTLSNKARQEWKIKQIGRRFEEVEYLESRGEIDDNKKEVLEERLATHIESLDHISDKFEKKGEIENAERVYLELETALGGNDETVAFSSRAEIVSDLRVAEVAPQQDGALDEYLSKRKEEAKLRALYKRVKVDINDEVLLREIEKRFENLRKAMKDEDEREYQRMIRELNSLLKR